MTHDAAGVGHNGGPQLTPSVRTRWAKRLFADKRTPSYVMAMAWVLHWYSDSDGGGASVSNEQFEAICGITRPTATKGKKWLLEHGYVTIKAGDGRGLKSSFKMTIPEAAKEEKSLPLPGCKGETSKPETSLPLSDKGATSLPKGETSFRKGEAAFPLNQENSGGNPDKARASAQPRPPSEIDQIHRMAMEAGHMIKGGTSAKSHRATSRARGELDGSGGVLFVDGKLTVLNGVRAALSNDFPGIDLQAVCDRAGSELTKLNWPTTSDAISCIRKWASYAKEAAATKSRGFHNQHPVAPDDAKRRIAAITGNRS